MIQGFAISSSSLRKARNDLPAPHAGRCRRRLAALAHSAALAAWRMIFNRAFAMPSANTFGIKPIGKFVTRWLVVSPGKTIDPFARNNTLADWRNDLDPATLAPFHMDAADFCRAALQRGAQCSLALFDPPYSPRQISECYKGFGREVTTQDTQNAALYKRVRDALDPLIVSGGVVLSFRWSSNGMGVGRGYAIEEILLVAHGGAHNDTICIAERKGTSP